MIDFKQTSTFSSGSDDKYLHHTVIDDNQKREIIIS
tara:strand:+ start:415 stop:522 length:108 start_codon:yes stop_codon:yes gene_type:complete